MTPTYRDYTSGQCLHLWRDLWHRELLFEADDIDLVVPSLNPTTRTPDRILDTAGALDEETMNGEDLAGHRLPQGETDGNQLGHHVAEYGPPTTSNRPAEIRHDAASWLRSI